jgi:hypothetical protein
VPGIEDPAGADEVNQPHALKSHVMFCGNLDQSTKSCTEIAQEFGYYDQMHMVHDSGEFTGGTPTEILTQLEAVFVEPIRQMRLSAVATKDIHDSRLIL